MWSPGLAELDPAAQPSGGSTPAYRTHPPDAEGAGSRVVLTVDLPQQLSTPTPQLARLLGSDRPSSSEQPATQRATRQLQKQHRLGEADVLRLVTDYLAGQGVVQLTHAYRINSSTVIGHLQRQGVHVDRNARRLTEPQVAKAVQLYAAGQSLATIGSTFGVDAGTVRRSFIRVGIATRPRRGRSGGKI